ncbi:alpha/beta hydrolase family protein [Planctomicrobium sp. SH668]|uniref:alpha/beta hydrolase family protein n=1 Tax=Planctomicrobium sp. SH668 TaxID=3448126 RepID=UPI003F5BF0B5
MSSRQQVIENRTGMTPPPAALLIGLAFILVQISPISALEPNEKLPVRKLSRADQMVFLDKQGNVQPVNSISDWKQRRAETLSHMNAILGTFPSQDQRLELKIEVTKETDRGNYIERFLTYQSEPGVRAPGILLIPKSALEENSPQHPGVLALHSTNPHGALEVAGLDSPRLNRDYGRELVERGYVVLATSYPLLADYSPDLEGQGWRSGMLKAVWDNSRAMDVLDSLPFIIPGKYGAIGHSLGGHNAVFTAFYDSRVHVVVSCCGLDSFVDYYEGNPDVWQAGRGWTQQRYIPKLAEYAGKLDDIPFDFQELIAGLADRHVLIIAPTRDSNFRAESVDRIAEAARPAFNLVTSPKNLQVIHPDGEHDFVPEMRQRAYLFLDSVLM